jgi:hypothetical protein
VPKVKYLKSIGGISQGEVRMVGHKTATELVNYKIAEIVRVGRPAKTTPRGPKDAS